MKKTLSLILALIMLLSALPLTGISSFAYTSGDWEYTVSNGKATVTRYKGNASDVTIPSKLDGYNVSVIGSNAFYGCSSVISVTIPDSITKTEKDIFKNCKSLKNVILYYKQSIEGSHFIRDLVTNVVVVNGVTRIPEAAFEGYQSLASLTLPNTVTTIGAYAFDACGKLMSLTIPQSVKKIDGSAFSGCDMLKGVYIPSSVETIGYDAFGYVYYKGLIDGMEPEEPTVKLKDFVIAGEYGSAAEKYAKENKIPFYGPGEYPDVPSDAWYNAAVKYVSGKGYIIGYSNCRFGPADKLKRQDFVVILSKIAKADLSKYQNTASKLKDVKQGAYYAAAVNWAVDNGIISGYQNGRFGVGDNITREQVATILYRYMGSPTVSGADKTLAKFKDYKNISSFAKTAVAWAVQNGIISGMSDGRVAPVEGASRAQIATIIMNIDKKGLLGEVDVF
ncbi:MAG: leucine-rich repeat protein [Clostridia bacterium]|nr:leucine-rich repeat protein [Clostridia bacterium]